MFEDFVFEEETDATDDDGKFHEYAVMISMVEWPSKAPVMLSVWAANVDAAMECGEALSAVYFGS